jgi:hypothetical protein
MTGYWYCAFGLHIHSEVRLVVPESAPAPAPDVVVRIEKNGALPSQPAGTSTLSRTLLSATPGEICSIWEPGGVFTVRNGREIIIDPHPGMGEKELAPWVQCAALPLVLHQRGYLVLHASSVQIEDRAIAFCGHVGYGKSTTAAAMHARGHRLLADDVVAVQIDESGVPMMMPGFPHLKLMSGSVDFLGEDPAGMLEISEDPTKRLRVSRDQMPDHSLPLAAVYLLTDSETCGIDPLRPMAALPELLQNLFVARMTEFIRKTDSVQRHFKNCTQLIGGASICHLRRPKSFDLLPRVAEMVEQHVRGLSPAEMQAQGA